MKLPRSPFVSMLGSLLWLPVVSLAGVLLAAELPSDSKAGATAAHTKNNASKGQYIRVPKDANGTPTALQTSIVHLVPQGSDHPGLTVDLVSAVHVADKSYYEALNKRFEGYDVVLYELVAPEGTVVPKGGLDRNRNALSAVQNGMKDLLELEYQLSGIDYTKANFVHADMSPEQFAKSMQDKGESFWTIFFRLMAAGMVQQANGSGGTNEVDLLMALFDKDRALKLKRVMAEEFADMDILMTAFNGPDGSTLITERNKAALAVLAKEIAAGKTKIAIFYGGGHMPDMEPRAIAEFHLKRNGQDWLEAWDLRDKK